MSATLGYLFLLLPVVAVAWIVWSYQRRAAQKEARSRERAAQFFSAPPARPAVPGPAQAPLERAPGGAATGQLSPPAIAARRERFLSQQETLAYYLLRTGLPGHEVFPHVSLASVLAVPEAPGGSAPDRLRTGRQELDFVVCDKGLRVVAAVRLEGRNAAVDNRWADQRLADAGVRLVRLDPAALPRREQVGALVLGGPG